MSRTVLDNQDVAQLDFALYLKAQSQQVCQYEIDSVDDVFGELYRVWGGEKGINLLGTFYRRFDGLWISQPCNTSDRLPWQTDQEAIDAILAA